MPFPVLTKGQGKDMATFITSGVYHDVGWTHKSLPRQVLPTQQDGKPEEPSHITQREDESLYEAWEQFKDLLRLCQHHGLQKWMLV